MRCLSTILATGIAVLALTSAEVVAQDPKSSASDRAEKIINDRSLFKAEFAKEMMDKARLFEDIVSTNAFLHWSVPDPAPSDYRANRSEIRQAIVNTKEDPCRSWRPPV